MTLQKTKPKRPTPANRKRVAAHHKHSRHYVKTYWPYLPILAILIVGFAVNSWLSHAQHNVLGYATSVTAQSLLDDTNVQRSNAGESALTLNDELTAAAQAKANDMAKRNYWSHVTPDGRQPWSFVTAAGYHYQAAGENLAYGFGSSAQTVDAWMHSAKHRANILNGSFSEVGFAFANAPDYQGTGPETIIVAFYGQPAGAAAAPAAGSHTPSASILGDAQSVSRVQLATGIAWSAIALAVLCGAALMLLVVRHGLAWHKMLVRGEQFVVHHPFFDIFLVSAAVFGFLLSHVAGVIM